MNKFNSIFGQILQIFSKGEFYKAVAETGAEKRAKGFTYGYKPIFSRMFILAMTATSSSETKGCVPVKIYHAKRRLQI